MADVRPPGRAAAATRGIRVLLDLVPNHTSERASVVRRLPLVADRRRTATGTCGPTRSPTARRPTTGSAASAARPGRSTPATGQYYLHNHLSAATRSQLVERGGARRLRRHPAASGSTGAWPGSGSTCATSSSRTPSCGTTRRPPRTTTSTPSSSGSGRSTTATDPRSTTSSGAGGPSPTPTTRPRILIGETPVKVRRPGRATTATAATSCTWPSTSRSSPPPSRPAAMRRIVEDTEALLPARCLAGVDRVEPRHVAVRLPLGRTGIRRKIRAALLMLLLPAGHAGAVPGRRDRSGRRDRRPRGHARSARRGVLARLCGARRHAHAHALAARARRRLHRARAHGPGSPWATTGEATSRSNGSIPSPS